MNAQCGISVSRQKWRGEGSTVIFQLTLTLAHSLDLTHDGFSHAQTATDDFPFSFLLTHTFRRRVGAAMSGQNEGLEGRETVGQVGQIATMCRCRESRERLSDCVWSELDMNRNTNSRPHDLYLRVNPVWIQGKSSCLWDQTSSTFPYRRSLTPLLTVNTCPPTEPSQYDIGKQQPHMIWKLLWQHYYNMAYFWL